MASSEYLKSLMDRREESKRREHIMRLIELIEDGVLDSEHIPLDNLYDTHGQPRERYVSPEDRNSYNYGYMEVGEMMTESPSVR